MAKKTEIKRKSDGTFAKGQSGNPAGSKAGYISLTRILNEELEKVMSYTTGKGKNRKKIQEQTARVLVRKMIAMAVGGNEKMLTMAFHYQDGKPVQPINHGGQAGNPIEHVVIDEETAEAMQGFEDRFMKVKAKNDAKKAKQAKATNGQPTGNQLATKKPVKKKVVKIKKKK